MNLEWDHCFQAPHNPVLFPSLNDPILCIRKASSSHPPGFERHKCFQPIISNHLFWDSDTLLVRYGVTLLRDHSVTLGHCHNITHLLIRGLKVHYLETFNIALVLPCTVAPVLWHIAAL